MKKIIEYVPIITFCLIYFGFCNLHSYFKEFKIDIYHYINNTEILLSILPKIVVFASSLYVFVYSKIISLSSYTEKSNVTNNENNIEEEKTEPIKRNRFWQFLFIFPTPILLLITIDIVIHFILTEYFGFKPYQLQEVNVFYALIFLSIIYFTSSLFKNPEIINENILLITVFFVIYIGTQISTYRKLDADKIKDGIRTKELVFQYNNKRVSTSKDNIYIGETQSNLFLYNVKTKSTYVYKTENIDSLVIK